MTWGVFLKYGFPLSFYLPPWSCYTILNFGQNLICCYLNTVDRQGLRPTVQYLSQTSLAGLHHFALSICLCQSLDLIWLSLHPCVIYASWLGLHYCCKLTQESSISQGYHFLKYTKILQVSCKTSTAIIYKIWSFVRSSSARQAVEGTWKDHKDWIKHQWQELVTLDGAWAGSCF